MFHQKFPPMSQDQCYFRIALSFPNRCYVLRCNNKQLLDRSGALPCWIYSHQLKVNNVFNSRIHNCFILYLNFKERLVSKQDKVKCRKITENKKWCEQPYQIQNVTIDDALPIRCFNNTCDGPISIDEIVGIKEQVKIFRSFRKEKWFHPVKQRNYLRKLEWLLLSMISYHQWWKSNSKEVSIRNEPVFNWVMFGIYDCSVTTFRTAAVLNSLKSMNYNLIAEDFLQSIRWLSK